MEVSLNQPVDGDWKSNRVWSCWVCPRAAAVEPEEQHGAGEENLRWVFFCNEKIQTNVKNATLTRLNFRDVKDKPSSFFWFMV